MEIDYITINSKDTTLLANLSYDIYPRQQTAYLCSECDQPIFTPPGGGYQSLGFPIQTNIAKVTLPISFSHGMGIGTIQIRPIIYDAINDELWLITNISITINLKSTSRSPVIPAERSAVTDKTIKRALKGMVENPNDVDGNLPQISVYSYNYPVNPDDVPVEYLIFTSAEFAPEFNSFKYWKTSKGCKTEVIVLDNAFWSDPEYQGVDNAETLRNFMIAYKTENVDFCYALLAGNYNTVPVRYVWHDNNQAPGEWELPPPHTDSPIPCDLYYADVDGDWSVDGDDYWGEAGGDNPDLGPDIYVGRLLIETVGEATNWIEKTMRYVEEPGYGNYSYLSNVIISSEEGYSYSDVPQQIANQFWPFFNVDTESYRQEQVLDPMHPMGDEFIDYFSSPTMGYIISLAHGHGDYFRTLKKSNGDISIVSTNSDREVNHPLGFGLINDIQNNGKEYITSLISSFPGMLDARILTYPDYWEPVDTCYAQVNQIVDGGSFAGSYNTRNGVVDLAYNLEMDRAAKLMNFAETENRFGIAHYIVKPAFPDQWGTYGWYTVYTNNLFADPEFAMHVNYPGTFIVDYPSEVELDSVQSTILRVRNSATQSGVPDVLVTLWKEGEIYERGFTNSTGYVTLTLYPVSLGEISIVCSKPQFISFVDSIHVNPYCADAVAGDANGNGYVQLSDILFISNYIRGMVIPPDSCMCPNTYLYHAADANGDCSVIGSDASYLVTYFRGGPAPHFCADCPMPGTLLNKKVIQTKTTKKGYK